MILMDSARYGDEFSVTCHIRVRRWGIERFGAKGIHIPYTFPIQWGAHAELQIEFPNHLIDEDHGEDKNPDRNRG